MNLFFGTQENELIGLIVVDCLKLRWSTLFVLALCEHLLTYLSSSNAASEFFLYMHPDNLRKLLVDLDKPLRK